jgi:hypothetical protein
MPMEVWGFSMTPGTEEMIIRTCPMRATRRAQEMVL